MGWRRIVVGLPVGLDGSPNDQTAHVVQFIAALEGADEHSDRDEDERLTSREAESRLASGSGTGEAEGAARRGGRGHHPAGLPGSATGR